MGGANDELCRQRNPEIASQKPSRQRKANAMKTRSAHTRKRIGNLTTNVVRAIRTEREYQDRLWGRDHKHTVSEWLLYMRDYLDEAAGIVSREASPGCDEKALHIVRKIAAMAVNCMEQNGVFARSMKDLEKARELHGVLGEAECAPYEL